jgi:N-acetylmuramoyl-L-alanine amidase
MGRIFLTAGHHLKDSGAIGNGYQENNLTIELRNLVSQRIKQLDQSIIIWNDDDNDTLAQVIKKIKTIATSSDYLLELHFDSSESKTATGSTALIAKDARDKSKNFATKLVSITSKVLDVKNRGVIDETKSNRGKLGVLHTVASSCLLEICFLSNHLDIEEFQKFKHWLAEEIALVIISTLKASP